MSPQRREGPDSEDDGGQDGEVVVLEVECVQGGAEGEGGGEGCEGVAGEKERVEVFQSTHGGREVGELGVCQVEDFEVGHCPELQSKGRERERGGGGGGGGRGGRNAMAHRHIHLHTHLPIPAVHHRARQDDSL